MRPGRRRWAALWPGLRLSPLMTMLLALLAALTVAAGVFALRAYIEPDAYAAAVRTQWRPPTYAGGAPNPPKPASAYAQTLRRPIFFKSRRPYAEADKEAAPAPTPEAAAPPPGLALSAIAQLGRNRRAFIVSPAAPEGRWYIAGDKIDDWTIADIKTMELTLTNGAHSAPLKLYPDSAEQTPDAAPAAPPPAIPESQL